MKSPIMKSLLSVFDDVNFSSENIQTHPKTSATKLSRPFTLFQWFPGHAGLLLTILSTLSVCINPSKTTARMGLSLLNSAILTLLSTPHQFQAFTSRIGFYSIPLPNRLSIANKIHCYSHEYYYVSLLHTP